MGSSIIRQTSIGHRCAMFVAFLCAAANALTPHFGGRAHSSQPPAKSVPLLRPAFTRDLLAEVSAATSELQKDSSPQVSKQESSRELVVLTVRQEIYQQLIGELVSHITEGSRSGTSWFKPLALRSVANATLATAAELYDPTLGWLGAADEVDGVHNAVPSIIHIFSLAAPAVFVPTSTVETASLELAVVIRTLLEAHDLADGDPNDDRAYDDVRAQRRDMRILQALLDRVHHQQQLQLGSAAIVVRPSFTLSRFYDPFSWLQ